MVFEEIVVDDEFIKDMDYYREIEEGHDLVQGSSYNPNYFSEKMLGIKPYSWQVYVMELFRRSIDKRARKLKIDMTEIDNYEGGKITIDVDGKEFVIITSRQIGKSTLIAIMSIWVTMFNKVKGTLFENTSIIIVSASDDQAKKLLREINRLLLVGDGKMASYLDGEEMVFGKNYFTKLLSKDDPNNTTMITFNKHEDKHGDYLLKGSLHGSTIKSYPPTSKVLGETASVIWIDEAAFTDKITDTFVFDYLYPVGNSTNAIRGYTSTPWATSGFFYKMVDPDGVYDNDHALVTCFTIDAIRIENINQYDNVMKIINTLNQDGKINQVQRAYYCRFVKGEKSYFNPEKVTNCFENEEIMLDRFGGSCDLGVDFGGQTTSKTVLTISYLDDHDVIHRIYHKTYGVGKDDSIISDIEELMTRFKIERIVPDDCPQGDYLIRDMKDKGWNVQPMNFRTDKIKKYGAFRSKLNREEIYTYPDEDLKTEMYSLEFIEGVRNTMIRHAPGYGDDLIDSFLLSCYFFLNDTVGGNYYDMDDY